MNEEKVKYKKYVNPFIIVFLLLIVGYYFVSIRPSFGSYIVRYKNNCAGNIRSEVISQVTEYCKNNSKEIPANGEFCISGSETSCNMTIDPCELIPEGMKDIRTNLFLEENESYYWTVKYVDGEAYCAWVSENPLEDNQLKKYEWDNQRKTYFTSFIKGVQSVVGYWDTDVKNGTGI